MRPIAKPDYPILENIQKRRSPRAFSSELVSDKNLMSLFESARWAASSYNDQPWYFIITHKHEESYQKLLSTLDPFNRQWVKSAPILILTIVRTFFEKKKIENRHAMHDLGLAMGNFSIQATSLNLALHQMAGFDPKKAIKEFNIPSSYEPVTAVALGYISTDISLLSPDLQESELAIQKRKKLSEFVFKSKWNGK